MSMNGFYQDPYAFAPAGDQYQFPLSRQIPQVPNLGGMPQNNQIPGQPDPTASASQAPAVGGPSNAQGGNPQDKMMMDYLMKMGQLQPQEEQARRQNEYANQLRGGLQGRQTGRVFTANHPLEFVGSIGNNMLGAYMGKKLQGDRMNALAEMRNGLEV